MSNLYAHPDPQLAEIIGLTFMLLGFSISFSPSTLVIVHFKGFGIVLSPTYSVSFCPVLKDLWEK